MGPPNLFLLFLFLYFCSITLRPLGRRSARPDLPRFASTGRAFGVYTCRRGILGYILGHLGGVLRHLGPSWGFGKQTKPLCFMMLQKPWFLHGFRALMSVWYHSGTRFYKREKRICMVCYDSRDVFDPKTESPPLPPTWGGDPPPASLVKPRFSIKNQGFVL